MVLEMWNSEKLLNSSLHPDFDLEAPKSHFKEKNNYLIICSLRFSTSEILKQHCQNYPKFLWVHSSTVQRNFWINSSLRLSQPSSPSVSLSMAVEATLGVAGAANAMKWESLAQSSRLKRNKKKQSWLLDFSLYGAQIVTFIWRIN